MPQREGLFKWEDSPGLEHHCGTCSIPLHNPRALQTCFGVHVEPCYRFHQQLHFVQKSHECFGCKTADEMRFKRHGEIAKLVKVINNHDQDNAIAQPKFERKKVGTPQEDSGISTPGEGESSDINTPDHVSMSSSDYGFKVELLSNKQKKAIRKTEKIARQVRGALDSVTKDEMDHVSEAIHLKAYGGKSASFADANGRITEDEENLPYGEGIDPDLVKENLFFSSNQRRKYYGKGGMPKALGGPSDEETPTKTTNIPTPVSSSRRTHRYDPKAPSKPSPSAGEDPLALIDLKIFERLGVPVTLGHDQSKKRKDLIKKLASMIKEDLDIVRKEYEESRMRQAGFWRFVSAATLENMTELHKGFSWATGELKNKEKYGESLKVTGENRTLEEHLEVLRNGDWEYEGFREWDDNAEGTEALDELTLADNVENKPPIVLDETALQEVKDEKRQKRLSSQEGFQTPKAKSNKSQKYNTPKSPPLAKNVLRIVGTNLASSAATKASKSVNARKPAKTPAKVNQKFGNAGFFDSLDDMEA